MNLSSIEWGWIIWMDLKVGRQFYSFIIHYYIYGLCICYSPQSPPPSFIKDQFEGMLLLCLIGGGID
jgi:hypothetical protein